MDYFKQINDSLGHEAGDSVLEKIAIALKQSVRAEDSVGRLSGDEFLVITNSIKEIEDIGKLAAKISKNIKEPFTLEDKNIQITASIGIAVYPNDALDYKKLIKLADDAMYRVKHSGRDSFKFYSDI